MSATRSLSSTLQHVGRTLRAEDLAETGDAELVARFARDRDEAAFTALVRRHGGLVLGVCRRVLRHHQDAEDAFQATFLVFARKADRVGRAGAVGNWLYGVAFNVARKAKAMRRKREARERVAAGRVPSEQTQPPVDDLREILDAELAALADKYRAAVILCDVMGLTIDRAAAEAGCPAKTLGTRLTRGRALLASRLSRRGIAISTAILTTALGSAAGAAVPPRLVSSTILSATGPAVPPAVAELARGVTMSFRSLKFVALAMCGTVFTAGLAGHLIQAATATATSSRGSTLASGHLSRTGGRPAVRQHDPLHDFFRHVLIRLGLVQAGGESEANAVADDKKDDKPVPTGVWVKKEGELKIDFSEKDTLVITPHGENKVVVIRCEYVRDKEDVLKAKVASLDGTEEAVKMVKEKLPIGTEFTIKWTVTKDSAKLEDVKGEKIESFKSHLEGEFEKK